MLGGKQRSVLRRKERSVSVGKQRSGLGGACWEGDSEGDRHLDARCGHVGGSNCTDCQANGGGDPEHSRLGGCLIDKRAWGKLGAGGRRRVSISSEARGETKAEPRGSG